MSQNFGPDNASLTIRTGRTGGAAKAGHDLVIEVQSWQATLDPGGQPALTLTADSRSLRVLDGSGGIKSLSESDKTDIKKTIDKEVLKGCAIEFRSSEVAEVPGGLSVRGELSLGGKQGPVTFDLATEDGGRVHGSATVTQSAFGMKPYSALFGALKVADDVEVSIDSKGS
ncbi:MAG TPA: YceI family protein [Solirubrobacteraceae bacterium]|nr:YceI family protein [Solirubrobacteraceae bacterium]